MDKIDTTEDPEDPAVVCMRPPRHIGRSLRRLAWADHLRATATAKQLPLVEATLARDAQRVNDKLQAKAQKAARWRELRGAIELQRAEIVRKATRPPPRRIVRVSSICAPHAPSAFYKQCILECIDHTSAPSTVFLQCDISDCLHDVDSLESLLASVQFSFTFIVKTNKTQGVLQKPFCAADLWTLSLSESVPQWGADGTHDFTMTGNVARELVTCFYLQKN